MLAQLAVVAAVTHGKARLQDRLHLPGPETVGMTFLQFCCRARGTDRNWTRVDRKMSWSPAASSSQQRARVLTDVKARPLRSRPRSAGLAALTPAPRTLVRLALADDAHSYTPYMLWSTSCPG